MSKAENEGELEGGEKKGGGGTSLLLLRPFLLSVGCCVPGEQEGAQSKGERSRGGHGERHWSVLCFILAALLSSVRLRELQTCCEGVDLGAGRRSADPWITSSE